MIQLAYFFLLQLGEYTVTKSPNTPFQLKDASLSCGATNFDTLLNPAAALKTSNYGKLEFTTHKNIVRGEVVEHITSGNDLLFRKSALVFCALYLRDLQEGGGHWVNITLTNISRTLKDSV